jgi:hypothetical protein
MNSRQLNKLITDYYEEREQISAVIAILEAYEYDKEVFNKKLSHELYIDYAGVNINDLAKYLVYHTLLVLKGNKLDFWKKSSKKRILKAYDIEQLFTYHSKE